MYVFLLNFQVFLNDVFRNIKLNALFSNHHALYVREP